MDPRPLRIPHRVPGSVDVGDVGARQAGDDRAFHRPGDLLHRLEVAGRGDREARLDHVHAQARELLRDLELLLRVERDPRRLLAVAQRRVEDQYSAWVLSCAHVAPLETRFFSVLVSRLHAAAGALFPPKGEEKKSKVEARRHAPDSVPTVRKRHDLLSMNRRWDHDKTLPRGDAPGTQRRPARAPPERPRVPGDTGRRTAACVSTRRPTHLIVVRPQAFAVSPQAVDRGHGRGTRSARRRQRRGVAPPRDPGASPSPSAVTFLGRRRARARRGGARSTRARRSSGISERAWACGSSSLRARRPARPRSPRTPRARRSPRGAPRRRWSWP